MDLLSRNSYVLTHLLHRCSGIYRLNKAQSEKLYAPAKAPESEGPRAED